MADMHKMAFRWEGSRDEGREPRVELAEKDRVGVFPVSSISPPSSTIVGDGMRGAGALAL